MSDKPKQAIYLNAWAPWGESFLYAHVWWCGDHICDCSQAQITRVDPNKAFGKPYVHQEEVWAGTFYSEGEQGAEAELQQHLAELEAAGEIVVITEHKAG